MIFEQTGMLSDTLTIGGSMVLVFILNDTTMVQADSSEIAELNIVEQKRLAILLLALGYIWPAWSPDPEPLTYPILNNDVVVLRDEYVEALMRAFLPRRWLER